MDHHLPDDRRITSGAVAAAWALVACVVAAITVASAFAPARPLQRPVTEQAALHAGACTNNEATEEGPDRSLRD
jgi:hypothetical protein